MRALAVLVLAGFAIPMFGAKRVSVGHLERTLAAAQGLPIEVDAELYQAVLKSGIPVSLALDLPARRAAQVVTAVYDCNTGRSGTLEITVHP